MSEADDVPLVSCEMYYSICTQTVYLLFKPTQSINRLNLPFDILQRKVQFEHCGARSKGVVIRIFVADFLEVQRFHHHAHVRNY